MNNIEKILISQVDRNKTPSIQYAIFNKEKIIHQFQYGFAGVESKKPVNKQTTFNAFSITKTFTALAILQLVEKGLLNIDDPVKKHLIDCPYASNMTIRQLLTHSAGIPNPIPLSWIHLMDEHEGFNRNNFFDEVFGKNTKIKSQPNEKFSYSNLGYVLLGQIIEEASKMSYEKYIEANIIEKVNTGSELGFTIDPTKQATGYHKKCSFTNLILGFLIDKPKFMKKGKGIWKPFRNYYVNGTSYGGLVGTQKSLMKYIQELLKPNCTLISDEYKKMLFTENYTNINKPTGMCLSWFKGQLNGNTYFTHAGGGGGYYCEIRIYPEQGIGSIIMFNRTGMKDERFLDKVDKYYFDGK